MYRPLGEERPRKIIFAKVEMLGASYPSSSYARFLVPSSRIKTTIPFSARAEQGDGLSPFFVPR